MLKPKIVNKRRHFDSRQDKWVICLIVTWWPSIEEGLNLQHHTCSKIQNRKETALHCKNRSLYYYSRCIIYSRNVKFFSNKETYCGSQKEGRDHFGAEFYPNFLQEPSSILPILQYLVQSGSFLGTASFRVSVTPSISRAQSSGISPRLAFGSIWRSS